MGVVSEATSAGGRYLMMIVLTAWNRGSSQACRLNLLQEQLASIEEHHLLVAISRIWSRTEREFLQ